MKKWYFIFTFLLFLLMSLGLYTKVFKKQEYYAKNYEEKTSIYVTSLTTPRGRILDAKGRILVDNVGVKTIVYRKVNAVSISDEIEIAYALAHILELKETSSDADLKKFWLSTHEEEGKNLITEEEYDLYDKRKLNSQDLYVLKLDRITKEMLSIYTEIDKCASYIYSLMNKGYYYDAKVIKQDVTEEEYARVLEEKIPGITSEMTFIREYPYGLSLRSILGSVGKIPEEEKNAYLKSGYSLDDVAGISYLEKEYDSYLKGEKDVYEVQEDGTLLLVKEGKRGSDLVLSIDIELQQDIENIVKEEIQTEHVVHKS